MEYLHRHHGISTETIYNDLYGFIQHQDVHRFAYAEFHAGVTLANSEEYRAAIHHYDQALVLNPRMATVYNHRADAHYELGEHDLAISDYEMALSFDSENDAVHHNLGLAHASQGNYRQALQCYDRALEINRDEHTLYFRFEVYLLLNEWDKARQEIRFAALGWVNFSALLHQYYASVSDFEHQNDVELPSDIAGLLARFETSP